MKIEHLHGTTRATPGVYWVVDPIHRPSLTNPVNWQTLIGAVDQPAWYVLREASHVSEPFWVAPARVQLYTVRTGKRVLGVIPCESGLLSLIPALPVPQHYYERSGFQVTLNLGGPALWYDGDWQAGKLHVEAVR